MYSEIAPHAMMAAMNTMPHIQRAPVHIPMTPNSAKLHHIIDQVFMIKRF